MAHPIPFHVEMVNIIKQTNKYQIWYEHKIKNKSSKMLKFTLQYSNEF